jgi:hypothetical protein
LGCGSPPRGDVGEEFCGVAVAELTGETACDGVVNRK